MGTKNDARIKYLINCVKSEDFSKLEELKKIYGRHISKTIQRIRFQMNNWDRDNLTVEAHSALFKAIHQYDDQKHTNAFYYIFFFVRDYLWLISQQDRNCAFPEFEISHAVENEDQMETFDLVENSAGFFPAPTPEENMYKLDVREKLTEYRESLVKASLKRKSALNKLKVFEDIVHHPEDQALRSIESRTGIPKTTVSACKMKILEDLREIFRTDYVWLDQLQVGAENVRTNSEALG